MALPAFLGGVLRKALPVVGGVGAGALIPGIGKPRRRRRGKRLTDREISELLVIKMLFGARSPILTIAGMKMLNRGG